MAALKAERRIRGAGTPEAAWQAWPGLAALPLVTAAELVPEGARAVVVAPHPDDEVLGAGGLMAQLGELGRDLLLVAVTDGSASHPGSTRWSPQALAQERPMETRQALSLLGLGPDRVAITRLGFQDGAVAAQEAALVDALCGHLRAGDVVLATWRLDGHPDHEATGRACAASATAVGAQLCEMPIWSWHWAEPGDARLPWARACRLPLSPHTLLHKQQAVQAFGTQTEPDPSSREGCVLPPTALSRLLRPFEVFFR